MSERKQTVRYRKQIRKRNAELALLSGQSIDVDDNKNEEEDVCPAKLARQLAQQVNEERDKKNGPELVLTLQKLGSRNPNSHDMASLIHYVLIGNYVGKPMWLYFKSMRKHLHTILLRVNCLEKHLKSTGDFINEFFEKTWYKMEPEVSNRSAFWRAITTVKQSKLAMLKQKISEDGDVLEKIRGEDLKLSMMMNLDSMITHQYPLNEQEIDSEGVTYPIVPTKKRYRKVNKNSPIFVMDCEMCLTENNLSELTRVSIIDEYGEVLIDTFVKPYSEITNYLTEYSGITEEMLRDVKVRLPDVQRVVQKVLPPDAILCGHSMEFDLRALRMTHPFCIDLSTLYNFSNNLRMKTSLRTLSQIFLREDIQKSKSGHCSVEDSIATLRLLRLKMKNGLIFGNVMLGWNFKSWAADNGLSEFGTRRSEISMEAQRLVDKDSEKKTEQTTQAIEHKRKSRMCVSCGKSISIDCCINDCLCRLSSCVTTKNETLPTQEIGISTSSLTYDDASPVSKSKRHKYLQYCVPCISSLVAEKRSHGQKKKLYEDISSSLGNSSSDIHVTSDNVGEIFTDDSDVEDEAETFNFRAALKIDIGLPQKISLGSMLETATESKTNFLCAIDNPSEFIHSSKRCSVVPCGKDELVKLEMEIAPSLVEYNAAVLEANCMDDSVTSDRIDNVVRSVINYTCTNGLVILMMSAPKRSIFYIKMKK